MDEDWKPEGILPPIAGWSCAYTSDENQGKPRAPEPPPVVTVTELSDWGMVLRASHGILNFQNAMDSILEEERRIVARFKQLVIAIGFAPTEIKFLQLSATTCLPPVNG